MLELPAVVEPAEGQKLYNLLTRGSIWDYNPMESKLLDLEYGILCFHLGGSS
ncbi:Hypothetical protein FKW44_014996 [Caligus rogercresseyi]|uniref:Uncharacterized protein n=1 Tax=Caligus rogercresseyi TaxID=217165 RepID=A0A7T8GZR7_CALRO|nr:Hypothetical protein FKW44_014996 [Caligus rogercresseyi]